MRIISHRANLNGPSSVTENTLDSIRMCIENGFDVEVDIRVVGDCLYLGHDSIQEKVTHDTLFKLSDRLWIHCKNIEALEYFLNYFKDGYFNYFWHQRDKYTLTSKGFIWSYPGSDLSANSINVMPEWSTQKESFDSLINDQIYGICTDYPILLKDEP